MNQEYFLRLTVILAKVNCNIYFLIFLYIKILFFYIFLNIFLYKLAVVNLSTRKVLISLKGLLKSLLKYIKGKKSGKWKVCTSPEKNSEEKRNSSTATAENVINIRWHCKRQKRLKRSDFQISKRSWRVKIMSFFFHRDVSSRQKLL